LYFSNCGTASASAKVASARKCPASRSAGKPDQEADSEAEDEGRRQRGPVRQAGLVHQDGCGVGAEGVEGAVPERELAVEAGQDVQAQDGDGIHQHQVELEHAVVLDQEGQHQQRDEQQCATQPDPLAIESLHTRVTTFLPNMPSGRSVSVPTISTSATVSFSSVPIT
jgi:hypothetical protein